MEDGGRKKESERLYEPPHSLCMLSLYVLLLVPRSCIMCGVSCAVYRVLCIMYHVYTHCIMHTLYCVHTWYRIHCIMYLSEAAHPVATVGAFLEVGRTEVVTLLLRHRQPVPSVGDGSSFPVKDLSLTVDDLSESSRHVPCLL